MSDHVHNPEPPQAGPLIVVLGNEAGQNLRRQSDARKREWELSKLDTTEHDGQPGPQVDHYAELFDPMLQQIPPQPPPADDGQPIQQDYQWLQQDYVPQQDPTIQAHQPPPPPPPLLPTAQDELPVGQLEYHPMLYAPVELLPQPHVDYGPPIHYNGQVLYPIPHDVLYPQSRRQPLVQQYPQDQQPPQAQQDLQFQDPTQAQQHPQDQQDPQAQQRIHAQQLTEALQRVQMQQQLQAQSQSQFQQHSQAQQHHQTEQQLEDQQPVPNEQLLQASQYPQAQQQPGDPQNTQTQQLFTDEQLLGALQYPQAQQYPQFEQDTQMQQPQITQVPVDETNPDNRQSGEQGPQAQKSVEKYPGWKWNIYTFPEHHAVEVKSSRKRRHSSSPGKKEPANNQAAPYNPDMEAEYESQDMGGLQCFDRLTVSPTKEMGNDNLCAVLSDDEEGQAFSYQAGPQGHPSFINNGEPIGQATSAAVAYMKYIHGKNQTTEVNANQEAASAQDQNQAPGSNAESGLDRLIASLEARNQAPQVKADQELNQNRPAGVDDYLDVHAEADKYLQLRADLDVLRKESNNHTDVQTKIWRQYEKLSQRIWQKDDEHKAGRDDLKAKNNMLVLELGDLKEEQKKLKEDLEVQKLVQNQWFKKADDLKKDYAGLMELHKSLVQKHYLLKERSLSVKKLQDALSQDHAALKKGHDALKREHQALKQGHDALRKEKNALKRAHDALMHDHQDLKADHEILSDEYFGAVRLSRKLGVRPAPNVAGGSLGGAINSDAAFDATIADIMNAPPAPAPNVAGGSYSGAINSDAAFDATMADIMNAPPAPNVAGVSYGGAINSDAAFDATIADIMNAPGVPDGSAVDTDPAFEAAIAKILNAPPAPDVPAVPDGGAAGVDPAPQAEVYPDFDFGLDFLFD